MPSVELKVRTRMRARGGPELVLELLLTPRGSGNQKLARELAASVRRHPKLGRHVRRVVSGTSKVNVHLIPSAELMRVVAMWQKEEVQGSDVPGQLGLFGGLQVS